MDHSITSSEFALLKANGLAFVDCEGGGDCLFRAISHQLFGVQDHHARIRRKACKYLAHFRDEFKNLVAVNVDGGYRRDSPRAASNIDEPPPKPEDIDRVFDEYLERMKRLGERGDNLELQALARGFGFDIEVFSKNNKYTVSANDGRVADRTLQIFHLKKAAYYGSTRKITSTTESGFDNITPSISPSTANTTPNVSPSSSGAALKSPAEALAMSSRPRRVRQGMHFHPYSTATDSSDADNLKRKRDAHKGLAFLDEEPLPTPKRRASGEHTRGVAIKTSHQQTPPPKPAPTKKMASKKTASAPTRCQTEVLKPLKPISGKALENAVLLSVTTVTREVTFFGKKIQQTRTIRTMGLKAATPLPTPETAPVKASPSQPTTTSALTRPPKRAPNKASSSLSGSKPDEAASKPVIVKPTYVGTANLKRITKPVAKANEQAKAAAPTGTPAINQTSIHLNALRAQRRNEASIKYKIKVDPEHQQARALELLRESNRAREQNAGRETNVYGRRW